MKEQDEYETGMYREETSNSKSFCNDGLSADAYEERVIEFEAHRNSAMDDYFNARPQLFRTREKECLFEAGFRMAWYKEEGR